MTDVDTLEIYDFDWSLFRSPFPPDGHPDKSWWAEPASLEPPHVPVRAPRSFWIEEVVREVKAAQKRDETLSLILTSRRGKTEDRVRELLYQRNIEPDFFICRSASFQKDKSSSGFKRKSTSRILDAYPSVKRVVVWEDTQYQLDGIEDVVNRRKIAFEGNLVTDSEKPK